MNRGPEISNPAGRWSVYASYILGIGMMICFASTAILLAQRLIPDWNDRGMIAACTVAAVEAFFSFWLLNHLTVAQRQPIFFRLSEWIIILVLVKLFTELRMGGANLVANVLAWPLDFPAHLLTGSYLLNILLIFLTWQASTYLARDLYLLELDEAARFDTRVVTTPIRNLILQRFLVLGMVVAFLAGALLQNEAQEDYQALSRQVVPVVVLYFMLGLALVSLTRFANLESIWRQEKVIVPSSIPRQWIFYSLFIILLLALLAIWLPTYYGLGFSAVIIAIFDFLYRMVYLIYGLILLLYTLILKFFMNVLRVEDEAAAPQEPVTLPDILPPADTNVNLDLTRNIIVWSIAGILLFIALRQYISFNRELAEELKRFRPLRWLLALWRRLKTSFNKANKAVGTLVQNGFRRLRALRGGTIEGGDFDGISLRRLNPRQKVFFYYLALVKRAGDTGLPRQEGQTPYEYAKSLTSSLESGHEDLEAMTDSFVEARYSSHNIPAHTAKRLETIWGNIRRILLERRRRSQREDKPSHG
jgi:hypothetical protein